MKRRYFFILYLVLFSSIAMSDWEWINPRHGGSTLYSTWGTAPDDIYAGGDFGLVCHFDGSDWASLPRITDNIILGLWGAGKNSLYAVAGPNGGEVLKWNGSGWEKLITDYHDILIDIWGFPNGELFVLGFSGTVLHFNGSIWETIEPVYHGNFKWCIWGPSPDEIYVAGDKGEVYRLDNDGWHDISTGLDEMIWGIWGFGKNDLYAVTQNGIFCHWNGSKWELVYYSNDGTTSVWGTDPEHIFLTGNACGLWMWDGSELKRLTSGGEGYLYGVWGSSDSNVFAVGESGNIFYWNGRDCLNWNNRSNSRLTSALCTSEGSLTTVGQDGYMAWVDDSGVQPYWSGITAQLNGIWSFSDSDAIAVGDEGTALHWDGVAWHPEHTGTNRSIQSIWGMTPDNAYAVGSNGLICHWDGAAWQVLPSPVDCHILDIHGCSESCIFAVGDHGTILSFDGQSWQSNACPISDTLKGVWCCSPLCAYAAGSSGKALQWNGKTWTQLPSMGYYGIEDIYAAGENDVYACGRGVIKHWDGSLWEDMTSDNYNFYGIWGSGANDIYAVGNKSIPVSVIFHWDGSQWNELGPQISGFPYCVCGSSSQTILMGCNGGLIVKKSGAAWEEIRIGTNSELTSIGMQYNTEAGGQPKLSYLALGQSDKYFKFTGNPFNPALESVTAPSGFVTIDICNYHNIDPSGNTPYAPEPGDMPLFICGSDGIIFQGDGVTWTKIQLETDEDLTDLWFTSPESGFCVGTGGVSFRYNGVQWTQLESEFTNDLYAVWSTGPDDAFAVGAHGTTLHWNGSIWEYQRSGVKPDLLDVWGDASNHVFAVGDSASVLEYNGVEWQPIPFPGRNNLNAVSGWSGTGKIAVAGDFGLIATLTTDYPEPTPSPTPDCTQTQVTLVMPQDIFHPGDACWLRADICHPGQDLPQTAFFVLLYAAGEYFFYPSWCLYPDECPESDYKALDIPTGMTQVDVISEFEWPETGNSADELYFLGALIDPEKAEVIGDLGWTAFGYDS